MISMKSILHKIGYSNAKINSMQDENLFYQGCNVMNPYHKPMDNILYICEASQLNESLLKNPNVGLIIVPDTKILPCNFTVCEWVLWPNKITVSELVSLIQTVFLDEIKRINLTSILLKSLMDGNGITELVECASRILGNPILLVDSAYKVLAMSSQCEVKDIVWQDALKHGFCSNELLSKFKDEELVSRLNRTGKPIAINNCFSTTTPRILGKSVVDGKDAAYIGIICCNNPIEDFHIEIVDTLCNLIAIKLQNDPEKPASTTFFYKNLLLDFLNGEVNNQSYFLHRLNLSNWKLKKIFYTLYIPIPKNDINRYYYDYLEQQFEKCSSYIKAITFQGDILILINCDTEFSCEDSLQKIHLVMKENHLKGGLSKAFYDLFNLPEYFKQSISSFNIGNILRNDQDVYRYDELSFFLMLDWMNDKQTLQSYCDPGYFKLIEYDLENNTEYIDTLFQYALNSSSISATASALFVHRNTIAHRLEKISEITGYDLNNGEVIFRYLLSYKIDQWLRLKCSSRSTL